MNMKSDHVHDTNTRWRKNYQRVYLNQNQEVSLIYNNFHLDAFKHNTVRKPHT